MYKRQVEYLSGYFYPEGTFNIELLFQPDTDQWPYKDNSASYYYSVKEYFDPVYYEIADFEDCTQWNYTRKDGRTVLLVMNDEWARIIADLQDALVTVSFASSKWDGGNKVQMTQSALEQISEPVSYTHLHHGAVAAEALLHVGRHGQLLGILFLLGVYDVLNDVFHCYFLQIIIPLQFLHQKEAQIRFRTG